MSTKPIGHNCIQSKTPDHIWSITQKKSGKTLLKQSHYRERQQMENERTAHTKLYCSPAMHLCRDNLWVEVNLFLAEACMVVEELVLSYHSKKGPGSVMGWMRPFSKTFAYALCFGMFPPYTINMYNRVPSGARISLKTDSGISLWRLQLNKQT